MTTKVRKLVVVLAQSEFAAAAPLVTMAHACASEALACDKAVPMPRRGATCWRTLCFKQYSSLTVCLTISIASVRPSVLKKLKFNIRYLNILSFIDHNTVKKIDMPYSYYKVIKCIVNGII